jgi:alpha-beta hydrolase superfamily lysophospholipase
MDHTTGTFTGLKNLEIFYQRWYPEADPRAVLVVVHGLAEHSGRYQHVAEYFVERGYAVYALDHRGHGRSEGERAHVDRFGELVADLRTFVDLMRQREPERGIFMIGHSMGGTIATLFAEEHGDVLRGLILSGAFMRPSGGVSPALVLVSKLLSAVAPKLGVTPLEASSVSRDPQVVARYDADPLNYRGRVRARMGTELLQAGTAALADLPKITLPILIMHGGADQLADPEGSRLIYEGVSSIDRTLKIYDGLYHEIFNEPEKQRVLADVAGWLEKR